MILRKPYAFFIKHFKLIHFILSFLIIYCIYRSKILLDFFNRYIMDSINLKGQELISIYAPTLYQVLPFLIIIVLALILGIMILKKKPSLLYIINVAIYIFVIIIIQIAKGTLGTMELSLIDPRSVRLIRDFIMISFILQLVSIVIILIRSIGFDFKKFDFKNDLKELEISEQDREEIEIQFNIDRNKARRTLRRNLRFLKYAYKENKLLVQVVLITLCGISILGGGYYYLKKEKPYNENMYVTNNGVTIKINKSYITYTDYKGNIIDSDSAFIILQTDMKLINSTNDTLDIATTKLSVGQYSYIPIYDYKEAFKDLGSAYLGDKLTDEYQTRILVYQIPKQLLQEKIEFHFVNKITMDKKIIKLKLNDLTNSSFVEKVSIGQTLDLKDSLLSGSKIKINNFDIKRKYKLEYNFCYEKECIKSYEYIVPTIGSNIDKSILKINGELESDKTNSRLIDLYDVIGMFGKIEYTVSGVSKTNTIQLKEIVSSKKKEDNIFYIEVPRDLENADSILIKFKIRNKNYKYILK